MNRYRNPEVDPDEIFSDALNIPGFDEEQFEGRLEKPISKYAVIVLGLFFVLAASVFVWRTFTLQVVRGEDYVKMGERNRLRNVPVFAERGVIYDRNGTELSWNAENKDMKFSARKYAGAAGLGHILGYLSTPKLDQSGKFWQTEAIGKDGIEKFYNDVLGGRNGSWLIETDVADNVISESSVFSPVKGENITLTADARLSGEFYRAMSGLAREVGFSGGAGIIMDVSNGEVLSLVSYPEYDPQILTDGKNSRSINSYIKDKRTPFLNRAVAGLYSPGSIVKPFFAAGALAEGVIDPLKKILSTGSISIPNPYDPEKPSVFKDWKAHGWVNMREAIAVSSDVYFYEIGGGFEDQKGMGIKNIEKYAHLFGLGEKTGIDLPGEEIGVIPNPEWKAKNFNGENWLLGNTYHTAIGQYGFQVTPVQMARAAGALANGGVLVTPHLDVSKDKLPAKKISIDEEFYKTVREGMRQAVTEGTAKGLNIGAVKVAAKTGTAEIGVAKDLVNSWIIGFFPYDAPKYSFAVVMERGPAHNTLGGLYVMRQVLEWMEANTPEYLK